MLLSRQQILDASDLAHEDVPVPEWGGDVRVRTMTGLERDALGQALVGAGGKPDMSTYRLRLVAACVVGEDGKPLFGVDEIQFLGTKSAIALERVYQAAERLNSFGSKAAEAVEAAEKN